MKKFLATLLAAIILISLSACGDETTLDDLLDSLESLDSSTSSQNEENSSHEKDQEDGSQGDANQGDTSQGDTSQGDTSQGDTSQGDTSQGDGSQMEDNQEDGKDDNSTFYSTNDLETAKKGNSGVFAYKKGGSYDIYYIIDFDEGYVYSFREGNEDSTCDRLKIESGDLNSYVLITYHDGGDSWSYGLHFKWKNQPDNLILQESDGYETKFSATDLDEALAVRDTKTIIDY